MVNKININFGGYKECTWDTFDIVAKTYRAIAIEHALICSDFKLDRTGGSEPILVGVWFNYSKLGLDESNLQTFNTQWLDLCETYDFKRSPTTIRYYEE